MSLQNAVLKSGATALTPTGGADQTFTPDGVTVKNGVHLADANQADFRVRKNLMVSVKQPALQSDGSYSKDRKAITLFAPKILASGKTVLNLIRIEREVHPESTAAEALELNMLGGQILSDSDFASYWSAGSLA